MLLSSNVALIGGNSTKPGSSYYALIKAVLSLFCPVNLLYTTSMHTYCRQRGFGACFGAGARNVLCTSHCFGACFGRATSGVLRKPRSFGACFGAGARNVLCTPRCFGAFFGRAASRVLRKPRGFGACFEAAARNVLRCPGACFGCAASTAVCKPRCFGACFGRCGPKRIVQTALFRVPEWVLGFSQNKNAVAAAGRKACALIAIEQRERLISQLIDSYLYI